MLSSIYFLSGKSRIENVKKNGKLFQNDYIGVLVHDRKDDSVSKFAFVVSKKVSSLAVQRNRIKRAIKEALRYNVTKIKPGYDAVFLAKGIMEKRSTDDIMKDVFDVLNKSILMNEKNNN